VLEQAATAVARPNAMMKLNVICERFRRIPYSFVGGR